VLSTLDRNKLFVAVHMRLAGDFDTAREGENVRGRFNIKIPGEWYLSVCEALRKTFGDLIHFHFFADRGGAIFDEAVSRFNPGQSTPRGLTECSDLILMALADLRVCSVSSYSMIASFLSDGPFIWYEPQLQFDDQMYSLWGMEPAQLKSGSPTQCSKERLMAAGPGSGWESNLKGYAMNGDAAVPNGLIEQLRRKLMANDRSSSLLEYGCLPDWALRKK